MVALLAKRAPCTQNYGQTMKEALSLRERLILELAAKGHTDKGIANEIGIAPSTVLTYWLRIRSKLGPHPRAELVAEYIQALAEADVARLKFDLEGLIMRSDKLNRELAVVHQFMDNAPEAMLIVDRDGKIMYGNAEAGLLFESSTQDLVGASTERFIPADLREAHVAHRVGYMTDPRRQQMGHSNGIPMLTSKGRLFQGIATLSHARTLDGEAVILIVRALEVIAGEPISERHEPAG